MQNVMYAILDIDGCCLDSSARIHHYLAGDYAAYAAAWRTDKPIPQGVFFYKALLVDTYISCIFITSRRYDQRESTLYQLEELFPNTKFGLVMRSPDDLDDDAEFKTKAISKLGIKPHQIFLAVDDRPSICKAYRDLGFTAYQTAEGY